MYITYIGHNHVHDMDFEINRPAGSGDYLALVIKSNASFTLNDKILTTPHNIFFLYKEGTPQYYRAYREPFSNDWFHFKLEKGEEDYFTNLNIPFEKPIFLDDTLHLSLIIKNMATEKYAETIYSKKIIQNYMDIFFLEIAKEIKCNHKQNNNSHYDKMSLLRSKIYNKPYEKWSVNGLAHEITLSPYYFQRLYKKLFGVTCMQDIINARIESAKYYLTQTDVTIKYISEVNGYENSEHFMRQFKKITGFTPTAYRNFFVKKDQ